MTREEIIEGIYNDGIIPNIIRSCAGTYEEPEEDLTSYIYLSLLELPDERLQTLFTNGQLIFFIIGMIKKQIYSNNSEYARKYKRNIKNITLEDYEHLQGID